VLCRSLGVPRQDALPHAGIDTERFTLPRQRAGGPMTMICTRKLQAPYQPEVIVQALVRVAEQGHVFVYLCRVRAGRAGGATLVREHGLAAQVEFLGGYSQDALPSLLAGADVYVSASLWDGTSPRFSRRWPRARTPS